MVVREGSNVNLRCVAKGSPEPVIAWRREGGEPIKLITGEEGKYLTTIAHLFNTGANEKHFVSFTHTYVYDFIELYNNNFNLK